MSVRVALHHRTVYQYDRLVTLSPHTVRLHPTAHCRTAVDSYSLSVEPGQHLIHWQQDPQANFLARLTFLAPSDRLVLTVALSADLKPVNPFDFFLEPYALELPFEYEAVQARELAPYLEVEPPGPRLQSWLAGVDPSGTHPINFLVQLNGRFHQEIRYLTRMEPGVQTPEETLAAGSGSCRDSAWLMVQILRRLGLAARFVSGYLIQLAPDSADLHAWAEVFLPGAGWVGLDPTSGLLATEGHIPLAASSHYLSAAPVSGTVSPSQVEFHHEMQITRPEGVSAVSR